MSKNTEDCSIAACMRCAEKLRPVSATPRLDVEVILGYVLGRDRAYFYTWPEKELRPSEWERFQTLLLRRIAGEPVAHIIGRRDFWSLSLEVNTSTLIPRPDTELLVEAALEFLPASARVLDLGTGTGAIALAIAKERPDCNVIAVDYSLQAVELAQRNAGKNQISNVAVFQSDWFSAVEGVFDIVLSNPPYIEEGDEHLRQGDVRFEPLSALVAGADGLQDIFTIVDTSPCFLRAGGALLVEHGWQQGERVRQRFESSHFKNVETRKDYGGNERMTIGFTAGE